MRARTALALLAGLALASAAGARRWDKGTEWQQGCVVETRDGLAFSTDDCAGWLAHGSFLPPLNTTSGWGRLRVTTSRRLSRRAEAAALAAGFAEGYLTAHEIYAHWVNGLWAAGVRTARARAGAVAWLRAQDRWAEGQVRAAVARAGEGLAGVEPIWKAVAMQRAQMEGLWRGYEARRSSKESRRKGGAERGIAGRAKEGVREGVAGGAKGGVGGGSFGRSLDDAPGYASISLPLLTLDDFRLLSAIGDLDEILAVTSKGKKKTNKEKMGEEEGEEKDTGAPMGEEGEEENDTGAPMGEEGEEENDTGAKMRSEDRSFVPFRSRGPFSPASPPRPSPSEVVARLSTRRGRCSALVSITPDLSDLVFSHSSWFSFAAMVRLYKHVEWRLEDGDLALRRSSFSSYPGELSSDDDFYLLDTGLAVLQTTNPVYDAALLRRAVTPHALLSWQRVLAANALARSAPAWAAIVGARPAKAEQRGDTGGARSAPAERRGRKGGVRSAGAPGEWEEPAAPPRSAGAPGEWEEPAAPPRSAGAPGEWEEPAAPPRSAGAPEEWEEPAAPPRSAGAPGAPVSRDLNSGTGNNQWMVLDVKLFEPYAPLPRDLLWVVEQAPSLVLASDATRFLAQGRWASYNLPFHERIANLSGISQAADRIARRGGRYVAAANFLRYDTAPRARIFRRDAPRVRDLASMLRLMRSDAFPHEPLGYGSPFGAVCARGDLALDANGNLLAWGEGRGGALPTPATAWGKGRGGALPTAATAWGEGRGGALPLAAAGADHPPFPALRRTSSPSSPLSGSRPVPYGCYDTKASSFVRALALEAVGVVGPTTDGGRLPPFAWRGEEARRVPHVLQRDVWDTQFEHLRTETCPGPPHEDQGREERGKGRGRKGGGGVQRDSQR